MEEQDKFLDNTEYDKLKQINEKVKNVVEKITSIDLKFNKIKSIILK